MSRHGSSSRASTPARPLYAARLPPIQQHPLGAPSSPRPEHDDPVITSDTPPETLTPSAIMPQIPKIRPTSSKPGGTMLSATSNMNGGGGSARPLPAIGEPRRLASSGHKQPTKPSKVVLKCLLMLIFLSIPVLIFILMMIMSGGFELVEEQRRHVLINGSFNNTPNPGGNIVPNEVTLPPLGQLGNNGIPPPTAPVVPNNVPENVQGTANQENSMNIPNNQPPPPPPPPPGDQDSHDGSNESHGDHDDDDDEHGHYEDD